MKSWSGMVVVLVCLIAGAQSASAESMVREEVNVVEPERNIDRATLPAKMPWCSGPFKGETWQPDRIRRAASSRGSEMQSQGAEHLCQNPTDPIWLLQAQYLIQAWMNEHGQSQAEAEAGIRTAIAQLQEERENAGKPQSDEKRFAFSSSDFSVVKPLPGVATAQIGAKPAWCDKAQLSEKWEAGRIGRTVGAQYGIDGTIDGALHICQRATDRTWRTEAGYILQKWMNFGHLSQADAEASIAARIQQQKFAADKEELCKGFEVSPEAGGETKTFAEAHQRFFGCGSRAPLPLWLDHTGSIADVGFYLEGSPRVESEIMRLYWLFHFVPSPWGEHELPSRDAGDNRPLLLYAIAQNDFAHLDKAALDKLLSKAPYNDYARTVVMESLAVLKAEQQTYEQAIDKLSKGDKDYQHILREVPKQAVADWDQTTARWKTELDHSTAFEKKLSEPSRSALKGCSAQLQKDAEKLLRSYKETTYNGLIAKIGSDPIASLLISRLAVCDAADKIYGISGALADLIKNGRDLRGPRTATYYAMVEAVAAAKKDRPRFLLQAESFWFNGPGDASPSLYRLYENELKFSGQAPNDPEKGAIHGVVKAVNRVPDGLEIVFKTDKLIYPEMSCSDDTRHPLRIGSDGRIEYYRNCKETGKMSSQDNTPRPVVIAPAGAALVKPGAVVVVGTTGDRSADNKDLGFVVYVKKTAKDPKIQTFFGFTL